jgi:hypothetical protein
LQNTWSLCLQTTVSGKMSCPLSIMTPSNSSKAHGPSPGLPYVSLMQILVEPLVDVNKQRAVPATGTEQSESVPHGLPADSEP